MAGLQVILAAAVNRFPSFHRADHGQIVKTLDQLRHEAVGELVACLVVRTSRVSRAHLSSLTSNVSICAGPPRRLIKMTASALPRGFTGLSAWTFRSAAMGRSP